MRNRPAQLSGPGDILHRQADALVILGHTQISVQQLAADASFAGALTCYTKMGNRAAATEAQAGLAQVRPGARESQAGPTLGRGHFARAGGAAARRLHHPVFHLLTCYRVLAAHQDSRAPRS